MKTKKFLPIVLAIGSMILSACGNKGCSEKPIEHEHTWGEIKYSWSNDYSSCTAERVCTEDSTHVEKETKNSTYSVTKLAQCGKEGAGTYTVSFDNSAFVTQKHTITIDALTHIFVPFAGDTTHVPQEATCERDGVSYEVCELCRKIKEKSISAVGHDWNDPTYNWNDDHSKCTASRVCKNDDTHIETETVDSVITDSSNPTCETNGAKRYTATFVTNSAFETQVYQEVIDATGHHFVRNEETLVYECDYEGCNATNGRDYEMSITIPYIHAGDAYKPRDYSYSFKNDDNTLAFGWVAYRVGETVVNSNNLQSGDYYFPHDLEGQVVKAYAYIGIYDETNIKYEGSNSLTVLSNVNVIANGQSARKTGRVGHSYWQTAITPELPTSLFFVYECDLGVLLPSDNCPTLSEDGKTITYGLYPQTHVGDENLISSLNGLTNPESNGWYLFEGSYYANIKANPCLSNYKFDDGSSIVKGDTYWFKCEPIVWNVLNKNNNEYYLLSSILLDAHKYDDNSNNYQDSDIRNWLNNEFLNSAFSLNDSHILITSVDNSASTTDSASNPYTCENTEDKVFLPSYQDYLNSDYGFTASTDPTDTRISRITDYAIARGASTNPWYWTRSSCSEDAKWVWFVSRSGKIDYETVVANSAFSCCVRPAINIFLNAE